MKKYIQFIHFISIIMICLIIYLLNSNYVHTEPVLYFSDIISGPKTGNSDNSSGRIEGLDGAIVTIWGVNLN